MNIQQEEGITLPSEKLMIYQWQTFPNWFEAIVWSYKDKKSRSGYTTVFTSYCMN